MAVKTEQGPSQQHQASSAQATPSLFSAVTQAGVDPNAPPQPPTMQSILEEGHVCMPPLPADLQAELASSASSSFNGIINFSIMQQQPLSAFDGSPVLAGDFAADLFSSPSFAVTEVVGDDSSGGAGKAAAAISIEEVSPSIADQAAFNAAAGM